jgi:hypothetical protein
MNPVALYRLYKAAQQYDPAKDEELVRGHQAHIDEMDKHPWRTGILGALKGGTMVGGATAAYGGLTGANQNDTIKNSLIGAGVGAGISGISSILFHLLKSKKNGKVSY